jgi:hypothetical protein
MAVDGLDSEVFAQVCLEAGFLNAACLRAKQTILNKYETVFDFFNFKQNVLTLPQDEVTTMAVEPYFSNVIRYIFSERQTFDPTQCGPQQILNPSTKTVQSHPSDSTLYDEPPHPVHSAVCCVAISWLRAPGNFRPRLHIPDFAQLCSTHVKNIPNDWDVVSHVRRRF